MPYIQGNRTYTKVLVVYNIARMLKLTTVPQSLLFFFVERKDGMRQNKLSCMSGSWARWVASCMTKRCMNLSEACKAAKLYSHYWNHLFLRKCVECWWSPSREIPIVLYHIGHDGRGIFACACIVQMKWWRWSVNLGSDVRLVIWCILQNKKSVHMWAQWINDTWGGGVITYYPYISGKSIVKNLKKKKHWNVWRMKPNGSCILKWTQPAWTWPVSKMRSTR